VTLLATALAVASSASLSWAGGFNIYEMSARATAMGGAFSATADDGSAIFYNPAGLAYQPDGWGLSLSVSPLTPRSGYARAEGPTEALYPGDPTSDTVGGWFFPTGAYVSWKKNEFSAGFGFFTPFGLGVEWERKPSFAGRPLSTNAQIQGLYFSPVGTYQLTERVALSAGAHFVKTHLKLESIRTANIGTGTDATNVADVQLEGTSKWSVGFAGGIMAKPIDALTLGVNYKMGVTNEFRDQDATFNQIPTGNPDIDEQIRQSLLNEVGRLGTQNVSGNLDFPSILMLATRYDFSERFGLEFDAVWFKWSTFNKVVLEFEEGFKEVLEQNYEDVWQYRVGGEFAATENLDILAGYVRDNSPQPVGSVSPLLPDADRNDYSIGLNWTGSSGRYDLTVGYMLVDFEQRSTVENGVGQNYEGFDGTYESKAHILTLGYNRRF
jgi:long-chain fatty acid transport protein